MDAKELHKIIQDFLTEEATLVFYKPYTSEFACEELGDLSTEEKLYGKVGELTECGPVIVATAGGVYTIIPPNHLAPRDELGQRLKLWKLSSLEGNYYYSSLEDLWEEVMEPLRLLFKP